MGADRAVLVTDEAAAGSDLLGTARALAGRTRARVRRPRPLRPVIGGQRRRRALGGAWRRGYAGPRSPGRVAHGPSSDSVTGKRQTEHGYDVIPRSAARGRRGLGRDQRAALPVAQGDHGREDESAGDPRLADVGVEGTPRARRARRTTVLELGPPAVARRPGEDRGRRARRRRRCSISSSRGSSCEVARLPRALPRCAREGRAGRARKGGLARRRRRGRARGWSSRGRGRRRGVRRDEGLRM
jgi:hypothetical protein